MGPKRISVFFGGGGGGVFTGQNVTFQVHHPHISLYLYGCFLLPNMKAVIAQMTRSSLDWEQLERKDHLSLKKTLSTRSWMAFYFLLIAPKMKAPTHKSHATPRTPPAAYGGI